MSFIIIEYNGIDYINVAADRKGSTRLFKERTQAERWASKHLAFSFKVVRIY
jgi:hypothetical protein